jgi:GntR family transcriptional regulator
MNPTGPNALYRQLADEIRRQVQQGELAPGTKLPSESELMEAHEVSRITVRQALGLLRSEGLVQTGQGKGSFVADPAAVPLRFNASIIHARSRREASEVDALRTDLAIQGARTGRSDVTIERMVAPDDIAARLGLADDEDVIVRRRVQYVDGRPVHLSDSWFRAKMVEGTEIAEPVDVVRGTNRIMAELGHEAVRRTDEISARMPTAGEADVLQLAEGVPVLVAIHTERDAADDPVEVHVLTLPTDRHVLVYEVPLDV